MEIFEPVRSVQQSSSLLEKSKYRDLLSTIIQNIPKIQNIGEWDEKGDLTFSIIMTDIGLTYQDYHAYETEIFSYFVVDFLGELLIRENLQLFADKLQTYDIHDYINAIEDGNHKRFGVKTEKNLLIFKFHVSLLKMILTEDLRETLG
jgi:hypothetical protein